MNHSQKGFSLVEVMIAASIGVFLLFSTFYVLGNIMTKIVLVEKKVEMINELDKRIGLYMLTGEFNDEASLGMSFSVLDVEGGSLKEFKVTDSDFGLEVTKMSYVSLNPVEIVMNQQLGPYMHAANAIYLEAKALNIDDATILAKIEVARDTFLSDSTAKWSSNTSVMLNLGPTQIITTIPLPDNPLNTTAYVSIALHTNADVTSEGLTWTCTAFGFDNELLPSWCNV
jgi:prepilin-type N-terminal cleavage/methylation domain-containing protein